MSKEGNIMPFTNYIVFGEAKAEMAARAVNGVQYFIDLVAVTIDNLTNVDEIIGIYIF